MVNYKVVHLSEELFTTHSYLHQLIHGIGNRRSGKRRSDYWKSEIWKQTNNDAFGPRPTCFWCTHSACVDSVHAFASLTELYVHRREHLHGGDGPELELPPPPSCVVLDIDAP